MNKFRTSSLRVFSVFFLFLFLISFISAGTTITDNEVTTTGNVTGSYIFGDGSQLTNLPSGGNTINGTRLAIDNITNFDYNYNQSDGGYTSSTINTTQMEDNGGVLNILPSWLTSFIQDLINIASTNLQSNITAYSNALATNISDVNSSLDTKINSLNGNASWNESYADTLYSSIDYNYNQSDGSYNSTYEEFAYNETTYIESEYGKWFYNMSDGNDAGVINGTTLSIDNITNFNYNYNQSSPYDDFNYNMSDGSYNVTYETGSNSSWNESYATTLYASIDYNYNETVYLETEYLKWWYNQTSAVNINFLQEILNATGIYSTYNATYDKWAYNMTDGVGSGNASWNQSLADTLYASIDYNYNQSDGSYNLTYQNFAYNMSDGSYNITYETGSNSSWNESYATTLYADIQWAYNQTLGSIVFIDSASTNLQSNISDVNSSLDAKIEALDTSGNSSWNESYADTLYSSIDYNYNQSDGSYNSTYEQFAYNESTFLINTYGDFWYNMSDGNDAGVINGTILSIDNITNFNYNYNQSDGSYNLTYQNFAYNMSDGSYNITYETGSNSSWNESYATTLYAIIDWSYNQTSATFPFISTASTNLQTNISDVNSSLDTKINELPLGGTINGTRLAIDNITNFDYNYNMSHPSGTNFAVGGNLTLGETITFTLGEIIDNIVDGWITITGGLNVTENIEVVGNVTIEGELNMTSSNITSVECVTFSNGASWCGT